MGLTSCSAFCLEKNARAYSTFIWGELQGTVGPLFEPEELYKEKDIVKILSEKNIDNKIISKAKSIGLGKL